MELLIPPPFLARARESFAFDSRESMVAPLIPEGGLPPMGVLNIKN